MKYLKSFKLFESNQGSELVDYLDENFLRERYVKSRKGGGFDSELYYIMDVWNYVDDEKFVSQYIDDICDNDVSDFDYQYTSVYDRDDKLIPYLEGLIENTKDTTKIMEKIDELYIESIGLEEDDENYNEEIENIKEMDVSDKLKEIDCDNVRELVSDFGDVYDFIHDQLENTYSNSSAYDILREFHSEKDMKDPEFFKDNPFNIKYYVDENKMQEDYLDNEDIDYIREEVSNQIENSEELQRKIFETKPETCVDMIEFVKQELAEEYDFQKAYITEILEDVDDEDKEEVLFDKLKEYFLDNDYQIDPKIVKEYDLTAFIEGKGMGFFE